MSAGLDIVICGLSVTSSRGSGHTATFRALIQGLSELGHRVTFLERDLPWYREHRDLAPPEGCAVHLYDSLEDLERHEAVVRRADAVIVGSYVPEGVEVCRWATAAATGVTAFYDLDTPVTVGKLLRGDHQYVSPAVIPAFDLYLSFTGGPMLDRLERTFGARRALPLYGSVDADRYRPTRETPIYALGHLGSWSVDQAPKIDALLLEVARQLPEERFVIGGPGFPGPDPWPSNVRHISPVPSKEHPAFYGRQRFTLSLNRQEMVDVGFSPSVSLFEAAACGTPIVSDQWEGLETLFRPDTEILLAESTEDVLRMLTDITEERRCAIAAAARRRVFAGHTAMNRAWQLANYLVTARRRGSSAVDRPAVPGRL